MWSLGVSEVKLGTRGGTSPGWGCRGQRPGTEWEGTWDRNELEQQFKGSKLSAEALAGAVVLSIQ